MAKTQQQRDQEARERRDELGEVELRHRVVAGTRAALQELMAWHGVTEIAEAVQLLVMNRHALGPTAAPRLPTVPRTTEEDLRHRMRPGARKMLHELMEWAGTSDQALLIEALIVEAYALGAVGSSPAMATPRHVFALSENVARELYNEGARQAAGMDRRDA